MGVAGAGGVDGLLAMELHTGSAAAGTYYYQYDNNGNVSQLVDEEGEIMAAYEYDPYGNLVNSYYTVGS